MKFVVNLRPRTWAAYERRGLVPDAWLLSSHRLNRVTLALAHEARERELPLIADNGTKRLIGRVNDRFEREARRLSSEVAAIRRQIGRMPRGRDVPSDLRKCASALAHRVVDACEAAVAAVDSEGLLRQQLSMRPTHLIAQEDFGVACLIGLDLEREVSGWRVSYIDRRNRRSLRLWRRVAADPRCRGVHVYAVLGAMDYNTARTAGRLAARAGVTHVAVGMAGINLDRHAVDYYVIGNATRRLNRPVPRRYVRLAQVVAGLTSGYRDEGRKLAAFHALGLGSVPMFAIVALGLPSETLITVDSTSPVHDAVRNHVLYNPLERGHRLPVWSAAEQTLAGSDWPLRSPFARGVAEELGHDAAAAQTWWEAAGRPVLGREHLRFGSPLAGMLPFFALQRGAQGREATRARVGHNHWVVDELAKDIPEGKRRPEVAMARLRQDSVSESLTVSRGLGAAAAVLGV